MDRFTISDIENLCGIKAHTLRIWEKRYGLLVPKRKESNHRYYDNDDLKHILQVTYLYHNGYKISRIAALPKDELKKYIEATGDRTAHLFFENELLQAAFTFDETSFEETLNTAIERMGFEECILKVVYPYFEKVGMLWMNDIAVPAQEHFSSNIIRNKIITAIDKVQTPADKDERPVILFTPDGEHHEIPLLFASYLFKKQHKPVIYLGANVSLETLKDFCSQKECGELFFHIITNFTGFSIDEYLVTLCGTFPSHKMIMSGPLTHNVAVKPDNCILLSSLEKLIDFIKKYRIR
jgi:DNA-binding transcriptional MerR regulator